jgi:hypothetical protein
MAFRTTKPSHPVSPPREYLLPQFVPAPTDKSDEPVRAYVWLAPNSGARADVPGSPLWADSVEKVESNATAKTSLKLTQSELRQEKPS